MMVDYGKYNTMQKKVYVSSFTLCVCIPVFPWKIPLKKNNHHHHHQEPTQGDCLFHISKGPKEKLNSKVHSLSRSFPKAHCHDLCCKYCRVGRLEEKNKRTLQHFSQKKDPNKEVHFFVGGVMWLIFRCFLLERFDFEIEWKSCPYTEIPQNFCGVSWVSN